MSEHPNPSNPPSEPTPIHPPAPSPTDPVPPSAAVAPRIHAVVQNDFGNAEILSFRTRLELARALSDISGAKVLGVFQGKKLSTKKKELYSFC